MHLSDQLSALLDRFFASFSTGDIAAWEDSVAADVVVIGTDDAEWLESGDQARVALSAQVKEMSAAGITVRRGKPTLFSNDSAAWAAERATMSLADGTAVSVRLTMVATPDERGRLLLRQWHLSVGQPNEEVLHESLSV